MTYCLAIKTDGGLVFASDSRTNAGIDYANVYSKMYRFDLHRDRFMVLLGAGSLATIQAVVNQLQRDLENPDAPYDLNSAASLDDVASYLGHISVRVQERHLAAMQRSGIRSEASFILGGQIEGHSHEIFLIYPQGNHIVASAETSYLQIGETNYGKPILVRTITPAISLEDAARCALVSLDSTMRSNLMVGPPLELLIYHKEQFRAGHYMRLGVTNPFYASVQQLWGLGIKQAFNGLPRFAWEQD